MTSVTTLEQINSRSLLDVVGYGECPNCRTERNIVQGPGLRIQIFINSNLLNSRHIMVKYFFA